VRARRSGTVDSRTTDPGQFVRAGAVLATLLDTSRLRLRFKISEGESLRVRAGDRLRFTVSAVGPEAFEGRIYHVGQVADPVTRQVEVLAWVDNRGRLKPGFFAETSIPAGSKGAALVVPETSIQATERGFVAYVVEDGTARARDVQLGLRTDDGGVEILGGLAAGETVITEGSDRLSEGMPVASASEGGGGAGNRRASPAPPQASPGGRR
jgi:multidrug efflux system membrane fusion protein